MQKHYIHRKSLNFFFFFFTNHEFGASNRDVPLTTAADLTPEIRRRINAAKNILYSGIREVYIPKMIEVLFHQKFYESYTRLPFWS